MKGDRENVLLDNDKTSLEYYVLNNYKGPSICYWASKCDGPIR